MMCNYIAQYYQQQQKKTSNSASIQDDVLCHNAHLILFPFNATYLGWWRLKFLILLSKNDNCSIYKIL